MKVDDDTFVNLPLLWDQLQFASKVKNLLMGHVFESSKRIKVRKLLAFKIQNAFRYQITLMQSSFPNQNSLILGKAFKEKW